MNNHIKRSNTMRQRNRLTESDLRRIVRRCVNEGMMDKISGAYNGMRNGFDNGYAQTMDDNRRSERNRTNSIELRKAVQEVIKTLKNAQPGIGYRQGKLSPQELHSLPQTLQRTMYSAACTLGNALAANGFAGFSDGSGDMRYFKNLR